MLTLHRKTATHSDMANTLNNRSRHGSPTAASRLGGVTDLLHSWSGGDNGALDRLMPLVYDELRRMADLHMRGERDSHTLPRTALVHEAYIRLAKEHAPDLACRQQFFALASTVMRHILVDHARARRAGKRGGAHAQVRSLDDTSGRTDPLLERALAVGDDTIDLVALDEALRRLEQLDAQQARVVEMRFFAGLDVETTAEALGLSPTTIKREWATARAWLLRELDVVGAAPSRARAP